MSSVVSLLFRVSEVSQKEQIYEWGESQLSVLALKRPQMWEILTHLLCPFGLVKIHCPDTYV